MSRGHQALPPRLLEAALPREGLVKLRSTHKSTSEIATLCGVSEAFMRVATADDRG
jgi:hypothetical protein